MISKLHLALPIALAALSFPVQAGNPGTAPHGGLTREHFDHIDTDGSGGISEAEYMRFMEAAFKKLDTDGSGDLTPDEVATLLTPAQFTEVDRNNDGKISLEELIDHVMKDFRRFDTNNDGELQP